MTEGIALAWHPKFMKVRDRICALAESACSEAQTALAARPSRRRLWLALAMMTIYRRILKTLANAPAETLRARVARPLPLGIALQALVLARA